MKDCWKIENWLKTEDLFDKWYEKRVDMVIKQVDYLENGWWCEIVIFTEYRRGNKKSKTESFLKVCTSTQALFEYNGSVLFKTQDFAVIFPKTSTKCRPK